MNIQPIGEEVLQDLRDLVSRKIVVEDSRNRYYGREVLSSEDLLDDLAKIRDYRPENGRALVHCMNCIGYKMYPGLLKIDGIRRKVFYRAFHCPTGAEIKYKFEIMAREIDNPRWYKCQK